MAHWYTKVRQTGKGVWLAQRYIPLKKDGTPYQVIKKADALKAGAVRSVTECLNVVGGSEGLVYWAGGLGVKAGIEAAFAHSTDAEMVGRQIAKEVVGTESGLAAEAMTRFKELRDEASDKGKLIHAAIDEYISTGALEEKDDVLKTACLSVGEWIKNKFNVAPGDKSIAAEHCFVYDSGGLTYGGTTDMILPGVAIVDWKSITKPRGPKADELGQMAAYSAFGSGAERTYNVFISQGTGRIESVVEWNREQIDWGWKFFLVAYRVFEMLEEFKEIKL